MAKQQIEQVSIEALIPYARNSRTHSDAQVAQIAASIKEFGFTNPVLIDQDGGIIAGHGRTLAARKLGLGEVPCLRLAYLSEAQKKAYIIADNKLALNAGWDDEMLKVEINELSDLNFDLSLLGFDYVELAKLFDEDEMPRSKFVVQSHASNSFKANKVKSMFDCDMDVVKKEFDVDIPIESQKWNVGLIVGASGTGKTTIAKSVFNDFTFFDGFDWSGNSIIDDFGDHHSAKNITEVLSKVGFASPPDWLKPFSVLSNGQKMRAELARLILDCDKPFIYDEFTSVVDRQVACVGSSAIQKFVRKQDKQFVAVSCHYDIEEWLEPDWMYDCNKMEFSRRSLRRPKIECSIRKATQQEGFIGYKFTSIYSWIKGK